MNEFKSLTKNSNFFRSRAVLVLLFFSIVGIMYGVAGMIGKSIEAGRNKAAAERQNAVFKSQAAALEIQIEKLKTEQGIEENIRDKFRVVKDGEGLVVIVDDPKSAEADGTLKDGWFVRMFKKIFN